MKIENLMKIENFTYFYPEKPTLVSIEQDIFDQMSDDPNWIAEPKYNGSRLQLHIMDGRAEFWDRQGNKLAYQPTDEILAEIKRIFDTDGYYVFDAELRHNKVVGVRNKIMIYDIHIMNNHLLVGLPFSERRHFLETYRFLTVGAEPIGIPVQYKTDFRNVFNTLIAENDEFEGLVMKKLTGQLALGRSSGQNSKWMKKVRKQTGRHHF